MAFRPIWATGAPELDQPGITVFTSESIGGNTLTLISTACGASSYPQIQLMLNDGTTEPGGTLYWKRLYK